MNQIQKFFIEITNDLALTPTITTDPRKGITFQNKNGIYNIHRKGTSGDQNTYLSETIQSVIRSINYLTYPDSGRWLRWQQIYDDARNVCKYGALGTKLVTSFTIN